MALADRVLRTSRTTASEILQGCAGGRHEAGVSSVTLRTRGNLTRHETQQDYSLGSHRGEALCRSFSHFLVTSPREDSGLTL
jgi:hypothetical protein